MNYENLKAAIIDVIKTNGNEEITGALMQNVLLQMINNLGKGFQFIDFATPEINPGTPDFNILYIGITPGQYTHFDNFTISENEIGIMRYNGTWHNDTIQIGGGIGNLVLNVTWQELYDLKEGQSLIPGLSYRITDYHTTSTDENTQVAGHDFDVIVTALSASELSEDAKVIERATDESGYFANSVLSAWKIKYCFLNDVSRFDWADTDNGKGVIYWMRDEYGNECPYDFKNIMFTLSNVQRVTDERYNSLFDRYLLRGMLPDVVTMGSNKVFVPTFFYYAPDATWKDATVLGMQNFARNVIKPYVPGDAQALNHIVMWCDNDSSVYVFDNVFDVDCYNCFLAQGCTYNTFGASVENAYLGDSCTGNRFGIYCDSNMLGQRCEGNIIGNYCNNNVLESDISRCTLGMYCNENTLLAGCSGCSFDESCTRNKLPYGAGCISVGKRNHKIVFIRLLSGTQSEPVRYQEADGIDHVQWINIPDAIAYDPNSEVEYNYIVLTESARFGYISGASQTVVRSHYANDLFGHSWLVAKKVSEPVVMYDTDVQDMMKAVLLRLLPEIVILRRNATPTSRPNFDEFQFSGMSPYGTFRYTCTKYDSDSGKVVVGIYDISIPYLGNMGTVTFTEKKISVSE